MSSTSTKLSHIAANPWSGNEHQLQLAAAQEAGLSREQTALALYQQGFASGLTLQDPLDGSIVLRGRTVLQAEQLKRELAAYFHFYHISPHAVRILVSDGNFELRMAPQMIYTSAVMRWAGFKTMAVWTTIAIMGWLFSSTIVGSWLSPLLWLLGGLMGAWILGRGIQQARPLLANQLTTSLARCAHHQQLILPPANVDSP